MVDQSFLLGPEATNTKEHTFKHMLLEQIRRLSKSTDMFDKQLQHHLISIINDKSYPQASWIAEIEEVEQIHRVVKSGKSVSSAVDIIARKSKRARSTLQGKYAGYKDTLIEIDQIFHDSQTKRSE